MTSTDANADANADADADNTNCDQQHNHDHADDDPCVTKENAEISATATATSICCTTDDDSNNNGDDIAITPTTAAAAVTTGVRFNDEVGVHAHNTVLGYHPDTIEGPPVQLGWKYQTRTSTLHNAPSKPIEYLSKETREETLTESGFRQSEMVRVTCIMHIISYILYDASGIFVVFPNHAYYSIYIVLVKINQ